MEFLRKLIIEGEYLGPVWKNQFTPAHRIILLMIIFLARCEAPTLTAPDSSINNETGDYIVLNQAQYDHDTMYQDIYGIFHIK